MHLFLALVALLVQSHVMEETYITIPIPVAPADKDLPISHIAVRLPSGKMAYINIPIQGEKTVDNAIATLMLWRDTLVVSDDFAI